MVPECQHDEVYRLLPRAVEDGLRRFLSRGLGFVLLGILAVSWLSLVTWSVTDPSLTHVTREPPTNLLGSFGATISDLLLQTLGLASVVLLFAPLFWGLDLALLGRMSRARWKLLAYLASILLLAGAVSVVPKFVAWPLHHGYGGIVGDGIAMASSWLVQQVVPNYSSLLSGLVLAVSGVFLAGKSIGVDPKTAMSGIWNFVVRRFGKRDRVRPARPVAQATRKGVRLPPRPGFNRHWQEAESVGFEPILEREPRVLRDREPPLLPMKSSPLRVDSAPEVIPANEPSPQSPEFWIAEPVGNSDRNDELPHEEELHDGEDDAAMDEQIDDESKRIAERFAPTLNANKSGFISSVLSRAVKQNAARKLAEISEARVPPDSPSKPNPEVEEVGANGPAENESAFDNGIDAPVEPQPTIPIVAPPEVAPRVSARVAQSPRIPANTAGDYRRPSLNLLANLPAARPGPEMTQAVLRGTARLLDDVLQRYGVDGEFTEIRPGPVVTVYQFSLKKGINPHRVVGLADDIARAMNTESARVAAAPGNNAISVELPNVHQQQIGLRAVLSSEAYRTFGGSLPIGLGHSMDGQPVVADLGGLENILVAGQPGTGKSTCLKSIVLSLIYRNGPEDCQFVMFDPDLLEFGCFNGIPHLLCPVLSKREEALAALEWVVAEMDERAKRMAKLSVRSVDVFNNRVRIARKRGELIARTVHTGFCERTGQPVYECEQMEFEPMPHIVVVIDELAALLGTEGALFERGVARICEKGRSVGIHIVAATTTTPELHLPESVTTGFKSQIAYRLGSKVESRRVLGEPGAERLLERGDMVLLGGPGQTVRVHAALVTQEDAEAVGQSLSDGVSRQPASLLSVLQDVSLVD